MAVPSYTTDLSTHTDCSSTTGFAEATGFTGTDGSGEVDTDLAIYGSSCISESQRKSGKGSLIYTGTGRTFGTGEGFFIWYKFFAPNALLNKSAGGIQAFAGSSSSNFYQFYVNGADTYPYGGWRNYFVDPTVTPSATTGSPTTSYASAGMGADLSVGISKGNSHTIDIIRYGRGELIITGGQSGGYAVFSGIAAANDNATTGRWGLLQDVGGSYLWKGLMSLGTSATLVDFRDSNTVVNIDDTEFAISSFNRIEVNNASSNIEWTSVLISALGTVSKGEFEMVDNATVVMTSCTFTDMSTFIYQSNATITGTTFRRCGQVTLGGGSFSNCLFANATGTAVSTTTLDDLSDCTFESAGTGHAINLGTISTTQSQSWSCTDSGYAATDGSTGNETILVNVASGQTLTINKASGSSTPTIYNTGLGSVVVAASVSIDIHVQDESKTAIATAYVYINDDDAGTAELNTTTDVNGDVSTSYSGSVTTAILRVRKYGFKPFKDTVDLSADINRIITLVADPQQT